jgi:hypothetical protein
MKTAILAVGGDIAIISPVIQLIGGVSTQVDRVLFVVLKCLRL